MTPRLALLWSYGTIVDTDAGEANNGVTAPNVDTGASGLVLTPIPEK